LPTKAICCRIFTPVQPVCPAASLRDFLSGAYSQGLPQDNVEAARWYRQAAEQGYALAQKDLTRLAGGSHAADARRSPAIDTSPIARLSVEVGGAWSGHRRQPAVGAPVR
jgi:hypothetical protein